MYEHPEIMEVGPAEILTLGSGGNYVDKCECTQPSEVPPVGDGSGI